LIAAGALILLGTAFAVRADACSCMSSGPPCQNYFQVEAVFSGTVRSISQIDVKDDAPYDQPRRQRLVHFTVERAFRGIQGATADVTTGFGGGDCGYAFKTGERYLVYAYRLKGGSQLGTGICSRTRRLTEADEDLQFIENLAATAAGARVYGSIKQLEFNVAEQRFVQPLQVQSDAMGHFEFTEVSPGRYVIGVSLTRAVETESGYPRVFYPGTRVPGEAAIVEMSGGNRQDLEPLRLPPALK